MSDSTKTHGLCPRCELPTSGPCECSGAADFLGTAHDWFDSGMIQGVLSCRICGIVKRSDGKNKPCGGPVRVGPRTLQTNSGCSVCKHLNCVCPTSGEVLREEGLRSDSERKNGWLSQ